MKKNKIPSTHSGYVALVGRPNVGKSTLLNTILKKKLSITSAKPQTTRNRLLGIKTEDNYQVVYVDTPGIYQLEKRKSNERRGLHRYLEKTTVASMWDVDFIVFVVEALIWREDDEWILQRLTKTKKPLILVINKIDRVKDKEKLLPYIDELKTKADFVAIVPISAQKNSNVDRLEAEIKKRLPENPFFFAADSITDHDDKFYAAEVIREKLMRFLGNEIPYSLAVQMEKFVRENEVLHISALILVERLSQKAIVIGKNGEKLKLIGSKAREDLEKFFARQVFLELWVKVKANWPDDENALASFGYKI